jgi:EAL domain-containing protein (putative c-di-GMP-specific phosphodiesterase class I)
VLEELQGLKDLGVSIALDDFGSGYSSIATLSSFPFDKIKLDKSFLDWARPTASAEAVIGALLTMGQKLGMKILAEGVETEAQLSFLAAERCDHVQGYLIGKPMPATDVDEWVAKFSRRAPQRGLSARLEAAG